jgi:hypothetical protein
MRATNLQFRSPKEKTSEYTLTQVTFDGRILPLLQKNNPTFPKAKRFSQYETNAKRNRAGPGSYNLESNRKVTGTPGYHDLHAGRDTSDNGFFFFGNALVYEPAFKIKFKKKQSFARELVVLDDSSATSSAAGSVLTKVREKRVATSCGERKLIMQSPYSEKLSKRKAKDLLRLSTDIPSDK